MDGANPPNFGTTRKNWGALLLHPPQKNSWQCLWHLRVNKAELRDDFCLFGSSGRTFPRPDCPGIRSWSSLASLEGAGILGLGKVGCLLLLFFFNQLERCRVELEVTGRGSRLVSGAGKDLLTCGIRWCERGRDAVGSSGEQPAGGASWNQERSKKSQRKEGKNNPPCPPGSPLSGLC